METQSERRRKGYPLQQSSHTEWISFVSALAQLFSDSSAINQLLIKHIQQHTGRGAFNSGSHIFEVRI